MRVIISGGGTGGHIYPAIAILQELKSRIKDIEILYIGTKGGLEKDIVEKENIDFKPIDSMGIPRRVSKKLFKSAYKNIKGINEARVIINKFNPDLVIGTGGFVCAPVVLVAAKKNIRTLIHESNSYPGMANKFLNKYVDKVCITYEECKKYFKRQDNIILTGNPVRKNFNYKISDEDYEKLNIKKDKPIVFSFGGSNGSYFLNEAIIKMADKMKGDFYLIHATGKKNFDEVSSRIKQNDYIKLFSYIDDINKFYALSDLVITSSGAMTLSEISQIKKASILIPKSYTTENHQQFNAQTYVDKGASIMILEKDLNSSSLYDNIINVISDKEKLKIMGEKAGELAKTDALDKIVNIAIDLVK
ncbi:MAG: undecaprenyldiphospho-muramoylpentapeptide beta-N-acetylglucosaminyltransferase [Tissierellia bacterium]|nr:undecaprenyldiphospho-muramoylpentapeptide beta-N-acetylglucosaminyltransferase [Tissierellia bacterium]